MRDPLPGDQLADWQLRLGTAVLRQLPLAIEILGLLLVISGIGWAIAGGLQHYWTGLVKIAGGLVAGWFLWRLADFAHLFAREAFHTLHVVRERRQREKDTRGYFLFLRSFRDQAFALRRTVATTASSATVTFDNLSDLLEQGLEKYGRFIM